MISKNVFPKIIKDNKEKKQIKESGCCFKSCGGKPGVQEHKEFSNNSIWNILKKIK